MHDRANEVHANVPKTPRSDYTEYARNPKVGDYWNEMLCPVLKVVGVTDDSVAYVTPAYVETGEWYWGAERHTKSRQEFVKFFQYGSIPGTWARCKRR